MMTFPPSPEHRTAPSLTFETLADPTRRHIIDVLRDGERAVNDIVERVHIQQSGVSRHLRILADAGFVQVRADGQRRLYSLKPDRFRELDVWIGRYRALWESRLDKLGQALARKQEERNKKQPRTARKGTR